MCKKPDWTRGRILQIMPKFSFEMASCWTALFILVSIFTMIPVVQNQYATTSGTPPSSQKTTNDECVGTLASAKVDIFFIVDSSSSIHDGNFTKMLDFVASIIEKLTVSPNDARIGLLQYNSQERLEFSFNTYQTKSDVLSHVRNVRYLTGVTYTGKAIRTVLNKEFVQEKGYRSEVPNIIVVLTDGLAQDDVLGPSNQARDRGIEMFSIGITHEVGQRQLLEIAGFARDQVFLLDDFESFKDILNSLEHELSKSIAEECRKRHFGSGTTTAGYYAVPWGATENPKQGHGTGNGISGTGYGNGGYGTGGQGGGYNRNDTNNGYGGGPATVQSPYQQGSSSSASPSSSSSSSTTSSSSSTSSTSTSTSTATSSTVPSSSATIISTKSSGGAGYGQPDSTRPYNGPAGSVTASGYDAIPWGGNSNKSASRATSSNSGSGYGAGSGSSASTVGGSAVVTTKAYLQQELTPGYGVTPWGNNGKNTTAQGKPGFGGEANLGQGYNNQTGRPVCCDHYTGTNAASNGSNAQGTNGQASPSPAPGSSTAVTTSAPAGYGNQSAGIPAYGSGGLVSTNNNGAAPGTTASGGYRNPESGGRQYRTYDIYSENGGYPYGTQPGNASGPYGQNPGAGTTASGNGVYGGGGGSTGSSASESTITQANTAPVALSSPSAKPSDTTVVQLTTVAPSGNGYGGLGNSGSTAVEISTTRREIQTPTTAVQVPAAPNYGSGNSGRYGGNGGNDGSVEIRCDNGRIQIALSSPPNQPFTGSAFVKGHFDDPNCRFDFKNNTEQHVFLTLKYDRCGLLRQRSSNPPGISFSTTVVFMHHRQFITDIDRAYRLQCFYMESEKTVTQSLEVSMLTTQSIQINAEMPACQYTLREGRFQGPPVKTTIVGIKVVHRWDCEAGMNAADVYGIKVHTCYVRNNQGKKVLMLDEAGCAVDKYVLDNLKYTDDLMTAYVESSVFKFADSDQVYFDCQISLCLKSGGGCQGVTPPNCTAPSRGKRSSHDIKQQVDTDSPYFSFDIVGETVFVIDSLLDGSGPVNDSADLGHIGVVLRRRSDEIQETSDNALESLRPSALTLTLFSPRSDICLTKISFIFGAISLLSATFIASLSCLLLFCLYCKKMRRKM